MIPHRSLAGPDSVAAIRRVDDIHTLHWQPRLGAAGAVVEDFEDIDQAVRIILSTPFGTDRHRPQFGWDGWRYLDWPVNRVTPYLVRAAVQAIRRWEKRVALVHVTTHIEQAHIVLRVVWQAADGLPQLTEVTYERKSEHTAAA